MVLYANLIYLEGFMNSRFRLILAVLFVVVTVFSASFAFSTVFASAKLNGLSSSVERTPTDWLPEAWLTDSTEGSQQANQEATDN